MERILSTLGDTMQQIRYFLEESVTLAQMFLSFFELQWSNKTLIKDWTFNEVFIQLHFCYLVADLALNDPASLEAFRSQVSMEVTKGKLSAYENNYT